MNHLLSHYKADTKQKGYMLIEIIVSLAIFSLITVSTTAALLTIIDANAKAQSIKSVMDNLNVAVENMSRSIRIGTDYRCNGGPGDLGYNTNAACQPGTLGITFLPQDAQSSDDRVYYYFKSAVDENGKTYGGIYRTRNGAETALTAPEVDVKYLRFFILGLSTSDGQPRVLMVINGNAGAANQASAFIVQTTIAERQPDCDDENSCTK